MDTTPKKDPLSGEEAPSALPEKKGKINLLQIVGILVLLAGVAVFLQNRFGHASPSSTEGLGIVDESILLEVPYDEIPEGALFITYDRRNYAGGMRVVIPSIRVDSPVGNDTEPAGLEQMPGLYEFSQMPWEDDANVSIAGHRDLAGCEFYDLHKVKEGDYLYLAYQNLVFQYQFLRSEVVKPDNWDVIKPQGFSCLTLTTCDPIGTSLNRLIVTAELKNVHMLDSNYVYEVCVVED